MTKELCSHCREKPVVARKLCGACYQRWKKNGTLEYVKVRNTCRIDGCTDFVVSNGLCDKHRKRVERHGQPVQTRPYDWGKKAKHPHWDRWKLACRTQPRVASEWLDFWRFVSDIGDRPNPRSHLRRKDTRKPFGPDNFFWTDPVAERKISDIGAAEYQRQLRKKNPRALKNTRLKKHFGITVDDYEKMLEEQGHVCAICGQGDDHYSLAVDHCHDTSIIRGLLCSPCNRGLGYFRDRPALLRSAAAYLEARTLA